MGNPNISLSPSNADTWAICTKAPSLIAREHARIPDYNETPATYEGKQAHHVAEAILKGRKPPTHFEGKPIDPKSRAAMIMHARGFETYCLEEVTLGYTSEDKVPLWYMPGRNGIIDFTGHLDNGLKIVDLKYGKGKAVYAFENRQMAIYARSVIEAGLKLKNNEVVSMSIYQPRVREGEPETNWTITWGELKEFTDKLETTAKKIINAGKQANDPELKYVVSDSTCGFCAAKLLCPARNGKPVAAATALVEKHKTLPDPATITDAQMLALLPYRSEIKTFMDGIYAEMMRRIRLTNKVPPGFKLVRGKGARKFIDTDGLEKELLNNGCETEELYSDPKFKSVNQVQVILKAAGWKAKEIEALFNDHVEKFPGKPLLVPMSDPRQVINVTAADLMDTIDDEDEEDLLD